jgi:uncharacterized protein YidB (DUF937 family)
MDDLTKLVSDLGGAVATSGGTDPAAALTGLQQAVQGEGGLDGLTSQLRAGGLGSQVDSWVSGGPNQPVDADQVAKALGPDTVKRLSAGSGLDIGQLLPMLAGFLPQIVNMLTPNGIVPSGGLNQGAGAPDLGSLLNGLGGSVGLDDLVGGLGGMLGGATKR